MAEHALGPREVMVLHGFVAGDQHIAKVAQ